MWLLPPSLWTSSWARLEDSEISIGYHPTARKLPPELSEFTQPPHPLLRDTQASSRFLCIQEILNYNATRLLTCHPRIPLQQPTQSTGTSEML